MLNKFLIKFIKLNINIKLHKITHQKANGEDCRQSRVWIEVIEKSSSVSLVDFWKGQTGFRYPLARRQIEAHAYSDSRF